jgi:hypothetical protein
MEYLDNSTVNDKWSDLMVYPSCQANYLIQLLKDFKERYACGDDWYMNFILDLREELKLD